MGNILEFNKLVGEIAGGICHLLITKKKSADCAVMTPSITYKVHRTLLTYPHWRDLHVDELYHISKKIHDDIQTVLKVYDIPIEPTDPLLEEIEKFTINRLEKHRADKNLL